MWPHNPGKSTTHSRVTDLPCRQIKIIWNGQVIMYNQLNDLSIVSLEPKKKLEERGLD